ncbi:MAG: response regulator [Magnetococcales bacterium]|nr:response regulator [Magnetococcales bacterium]
MAHEPQAETPLHTFQAASLSITMIKLLIIDRPGYMRVFTHNLLKFETDIQVSSLKANGRIPLEEISRLEPDVIALGIDTPQMDGVRITRELLEMYPRPILLINSLPGNDMTDPMKALEVGAVDYLAWPFSQKTMDADGMHAELAGKVRFWAERGLPGSGEKKHGNGGLTHPQAYLAKNRSSHPSDSVIKAIDTIEESVDLVVIGAENGGLGILPQLLRKLEGLPFPIVVAQKLTGGGIGNLVHYLRKQTHQSIRLGEPGMMLEPGTVTFIPDNLSGIVRRNIGGHLALHIQYQPGFGPHPSVDALFQSAVMEACCPVGVMLSGSGSDGTHAARSFHANGFPLLVQTPTTSLVNDMPKAALTAHPQALSLPVEGISHFINLLGKSNHPAT